MSTASEERSIAALQRRTVWLLTAGQILGGLGVGSTVSIGALLAEHVSGSAAWSGMAATMSTLGAAGLAIPLARLAGRRGRRIALGTGAILAAFGGMLAIFAASIPSFPLLLLALAMLGSGSAVNLQARFAATDLATPRHRGRDLSLVVWSTTIGAVLGPNLVGPGEALGASIHLPVLTGPLLFTIVAQFAAAAVYSIGLRPDPLLTRQVIAAQPSSSGPTAAQIASLADPRRAALAIVILALSHATMVAVMSMTPVHLSMEGASITIVGLVISLHIAGMYGLSPIFGILSDRMGRIPTVLVGQVLLAAAVITTALGGMNHTAVTIGLILLGLGWSASTVAGSALLTESVEPARRTIWQGRSDLSMNLAGALGGALAGPTLAIFGYSGLSVAAGLLVLVVLLAIAVVGLTRRTPASV